MAKICEVCGKHTSTGNKIIRRGMAKRKGGIGLHTTGITGRKFLPNLHKIRVTVAGGTARMTVCAACIKAEKIVKA